VVGAAAAPYPLWEPACLSQRFLKKQENVMGFANYKIFGRPGKWHVEHDGKVANTYETKEAAFEAAAAAASLALREGHEIKITAPGSQDGAETTTGAPA
jgi:hypothetical protein